MCEECSGIGFYLGEKGLVERCSACPVWEEGMQAARARVDAEGVEAVWELVCRHVVGWPVGLSGLEEMTLIDACTERGYPAPCGTCQGKGYWEKPEEGGEVDVMECRSCDVYPAALREARELVREMGADAVIDRMLDPEAALAMAPVLVLAIQEALNDDILDPRSQDDADAYQAAQEAEERYWNPGGAQDGERGW